MKTFKIHASQCGKIMAYPEKNEIPKGALTYINEWAISQRYNRKNEFSSKYTQKGNNVEEMALKFIGEQIKIEGLEKNNEFFENDFCCGTPDVVNEEILLDNKSPFTPFTFPLFDSELPNKDYFYQLQIYMALTGHEKASLIYTLMDTPEKIIRKECAYFCSANDIEFTPEIFEEFKAKMTYSDIPDTDKIKIFEVVKDEKIIEQIKKRVELIQEFVKVKY